MRVATIYKESDSVTSSYWSRLIGSFFLFKAGQFVVLRLGLDPDKPPVLRSYSLSDLPATDHLRISVKTELNGIGSSFLCSRAQVGDLLDISAPREILHRPSQNPVVLLSAGVGATPVMSMLHALAAERSQREIWWIYGARNRVEHPFAEESRSLLKQLSRGRGYIVYSRPAATDQVGADFDAPGHIESLLLEKIGVSRNSDFYCVVRLHFWRNGEMGLRVGCARRECAHRNLRLCRGSYPWHGASRSDSSSTSRVAGIWPPVCSERSGVTAAWDPKFGSLLELAGASDVPVIWSCRAGFVIPA